MAPPRWVQQAVSAGWPMGEAVRGATTSVANAGSRGGERAIGREGSALGGLSRWRLCPCGRGSDLDAGEGIFRLSIDLGAEQDAGGQQPETQQHAHGLLRTPIVLPDLGSLQQTASDP